VSTRPFDNGAQADDWAARNCLRCALGYEPCTGDRYLCEIERAIDIAAFGDGTVSDVIATRMGYQDDGAINWDCPERQEKPPCHP